MWACIQWRRAPALFDDAFISYRYAYNLVRGVGLVYNPGERVQGYTNFLWTLLAAAAIKLGRDPLAATRWLGVVAYAVACGLTAWLASLAGPHPLRRASALAITCLLILQKDFASFAGTGLETSFVALLLLAHGLVNHLAPRQRRRHRILAAVLPLVLVLTRLDTALAVVASVLATICFDSDVHGKSRIRALIDRFGLMALGVVAYLLWTRVYYGDWLPNTYFAKEADGLHPEVGAAYLAAFVQSCPASLIMLMLIGYGLSAARGPKRAFLAYVAAATALQSLYAVKVGGDFMEYRFMWEYWPTVVCGGVVAVDALAVRMLLGTTFCSALALAVASFPTVLEKRYGMQSLSQMDGYAHLSERVGSALGQALPSDTMLATTLAGMAYFMPDVTVIDQWGLNDKFVAHMRLNRYIEVDGFNARGHLKYAPLMYLRSRGVNLYVEHPVVCDCSRPRLENKPDVFVRLGSRNECVRAWYMTQSADLTRWFCSHPDKFVLRNVSCPAE